MRIPHESILKSALSSAHIEGNPLSMKDVFRLYQSYLSPKRAEIVEIVREHKMVSFDFISRRFRGVPSRTLHYDLSRLIKSGYLRRLGTTRGALYVVGEKAVCV